MSTSKGRESAVRATPRPSRLEGHSDVEHIALDVPLDALDDDRDMSGKEGERKADRRDGDQDDRVCTGPRSTMESATPRACRAHLRSSRLTVENPFPLIAGAASAFPSAYRLRNATRNPDSQDAPVRAFPLPSSSRTTSSTPRSWTSSSSVPARCWSGTRAFVRKMLRLLLAAAGPQRVIAMRSGPSRRPRSGWRGGAYRQKGRRRTCYRGGRARPAGSGSSGSVRQRVRRGGRPVSRRRRLRSGGKRQRQLLEAGRSTRLRTGRSSRRGRGGKRTSRRRLRGGPSSSTKRA